MDPSSIGYDTYPRNSIVESYDQFRAFSGPYSNILYEKMAQIPPEHFPNAYCTIFHLNMDFGMEYGHMNKSITS